MAFTTFDNAPYLYRKSGGGGDKEIDKLVGGTIAWNQLTISNDNAVNVTKYGITCTKAAGAVGEWTFSGTSEAVSSDSNFYASIKVVTVEANHVYLARTKSSWFSMYCYGAVVGSTTQLEYMVKATDRGAEYFSFRPYRNLPVGTVINEVIRPQFHDLTLMFGTTVADYVYSLEQSSQGSGLAWLRSYGFFTEDYYAYNSGELKSVSNLVSHDMTGKNLLNLNATGKTQNGITFTVNADGSIKVNGTATGSISLNGTTGAPSKISAGTTVTLSGVEGFTTNQMYLQLIYTGADGSTISIVNTASPTTYTFAQDATFASFWLSVRPNATINNAMVYPQLEFGSTATSYEPYTLHSYPLGDVTLRGLPKLNGNALYYDGDTYESNGTVTRKYGVVDLGTLTWYSISGERVRTNATIATSAKPGNTSKANIIAQNYVNAESNYALANDTSLLGYISIASDGGAAVRLRDGETTPTGYLVYELASSTTETADTYTNPQWVDPNGTEKYTLSTSAFPMPVGHETTYNTDMGSKTVNTQVNLSMTEPQVRQVYAKEGDTARVLNIHLDQTEEDGTLRILRPDGTEVTADAVLVPDFYDGLMAEIPSDATEIVGKCYCDVEQNGVSSMPFTLNVKKNERES